MGVEFAFKQMRVYRAARSFAAEAAALARLLDRVDWPVANQLVRASISIMLNIAEGSGEYRSLEKARFYRMARRSCYETAAIVDHLLSTHRLGAEEAQSFDTKLARMAADLSALIHSMEARPHR
jgi:four helix bundle protein